MQRTALIFAALIAVIATPAFSAQQTNEQLAAEMAQLKAEVAQLRAQQNESWLTERRAEEVKTLIHEVLSDAETRASLLDSDLTAGWNENFFLASGDGKFLLKVTGMIQVRWVLNTVDFDDDSNNDTDGHGFEVRRAKLQFAGHIGDPKFQYLVRLAADADNSIDDDSETAFGDEDGGDVFLEAGWISYTFDNGITVRGGRFRAPFLREELTDAQHQLAADRTYVNEIFTVGYTEGVEVSYAAEKWKVAVMINDGFQAGEYSRIDPFYPDDSDPEGNAWNDKDSDFALTARVDVMLMGNWSQMQDFTAWAGEDTAVFLGVAFHLEDDEDDGDSDSDQNDFWMWTVDVSAEWQSWGIYAAVIGSHTEYDEATTDADPDVYGFIVQGSYNFNDKIEPFIRYEKICPDNEDFVSGETGGEHQAFLTFGANWYLKKHAAKMTADIVYSLGSVEVGMPHLGLFNVDESSGTTSSDSEDEMWAVRLQFQLLF